MEQNHLPIIDWDLAFKLAGNKKDLAKDMLKLFVKNLPKDLQEIKQLYAKRAYGRLQQQVHKLHSALCYCGLPRLKNIIADLETTLKSNIMSTLPSLFDELDTEVKLLLEHYSHLAS